MERLSSRAPDGLSPLVEVERAVQERAKATSLDMGDPSGVVRLRRLIEDEVRRWSDDHKRGLRPFDLPDPELVVERAFRNLAGYGPLQPLLDDDDVWEIMINGPGLIHPDLEVHLPETPERPVP